MNNEGSIAQRGVESLVALFSHPLVSEIMRRFSDQDLMMCITLWGPSARGKVKLLTPKETSEGVDSHTKTDIYRSVSRNLFMHSHKRYLNEQI